MFRCYLFVCLMSCTLLFLEFTPTFLWMNVKYIIYGKSETLMSNEIMANTQISKHFFNSIVRVIEDSAYETFDNECFQDWSIVAIVCTISDDSKAQQITSNDKTSGCTLQHGPNICDWSPKPTKWWTQLRQLQQLKMMAIFNLKDEDRSLFLMMPVVVTNSMSFTWRSVHLATNFLL